MNFAGFSFFKKKMENKILYITQNGKLYRKDNTLFFENENIKKTIPIISLEEIFCLGEVSVNSKLLSYLTENKITIHFFNYYGYYIGSYYPKETYVSGKLVIKQVEYYQNLEKRVKIAKSIVRQIGKNAVYILYHYKRHGKNVDKHIEKIKENLILLNNQNSIEQILMIEGNIWGNFYSSFKQFLPSEFVLNKRVKKPPDNPINALISFGNSILYSHTLTKLYHTQLNPTISYLHEPFERRFSLALDLAEVFKFPLTFGVIFKLINKGILKVEQHFDEDLNYAYLNESGRKIFLKAWNKKIQETFLHKTLKRKVSYSSLIKLDAYKLIKHLLGEKEFVAFDLENKV